jgi:ABC-type glycerol-3-phosphate transport system permease component
VEFWAIFTVFVEIFRVIFELLRFANQVVVALELAPTHSPPPHSCSAQHLLWELYHTVSTSTYQRINTSAQSSTHQHINTVTNTVINTVIKHINTSTVINLIC